MDHWITDFALRNWPTSLDRGSRQKEGHHHSCLLERKSPQWRHHAEVGFVFFFFKYDCCRLLNIQFSSPRSRNAAAYWAECCALCYPCKVLSEAFAKFLNLAERTNNTEQIFIRLTMVQCYYQTFLCWKCMAESTKQLTSCCVTFPGLRKFEWPGTRIV